MRPNGVIPHSTPYDGPSPTFFRPVSIWCQIQQYHLEVASARKKAPRYNCRTIVSSNITLDVATGFP
jgi:hypothetical protein